jgi:hypothetical protein
MGAEDKRPTAQHEGEKYSAPVHTNSFQKHKTTAQKVVNFTFYINPKMRFLNENK